MATNYSSMLINPIIMDKESTEIIKNIYFEGYFQKALDIMDSSMTGSDNSRVDATVEAVPSKRNITNATTAHLSAQIMDLPSCDLDEYISSKATKKPENIVYRDINIMKRIKDAYAECSCTVCRCLTPKTIIPHTEFCDCEPCKCKDCVALRNNLFDSLNFRLNIENKSNNILNYSNCWINNIKSCNCKPCDCTECSQHFNTFRSKAKREIENKVIESKLNDVTIFPTGKKSQQEILRLKAQIGKDMDCVSNLARHDLADPPTLKEITLSTREYEECENPFCSHKRWTDEISRYPATSSLVTKCGCDVCNCLQCEMKLEWKNESNAKFSRKRFGQLQLKAQSPQNYKHGKISYVTYKNA